MRNMLLAAFMAMHIVTAMEPLAEDQEIDRVKPSERSSAVQVVRSEEVWTQNPALVVSSLDTIRKAKAVEAIPLLVAHIEFSPVSEEADMTMGNIATLYPVTSCLIDLGEESARGVISYLGKTDQSPSASAMIQFKRVLVATAGKLRAKQMLQNEYANASMQDKKERLEKLIRSIPD